MKITVDRDLCIGAANCVAILPVVFQLDEFNKAVVLTDDAEEDLIWQAAESCPTNAIILEDDETGEILYP